MIFYLIIALISGTFIQKVISASMLKAGEEDKDYVGYQSLELKRGGYVTVPSYSKSSEWRAFGYTFLAYMLTVPFQQVTYQASVILDNSVEYYHIANTKPYFLLEAPLVLGNEVYDFAGYLRHPCKWRFRFPGGVWYVKCSVAVSWN